MQESIASLERDITAYRNQLTDESSNLVATKESILVLQQDLFKTREELNELQDSKEAWLSERVTLLQRIQELSDKATEGKRQLVDISCLELQLAGAKEQLEIQEKRFNDGMARLNDKVREATKEAQESRMRVKVLEKSLDESKAQTDSSLKAAWMEVDDLRRQCKRLSVTKIESLESQVQKESMVLPNQIVMLEPTEPSESETLLLDVCQCE